MLDERVFGGSIGHTGRTAVSTLCGQHRLSEINAASQRRIAAPRRADRMTVLAPGSIAAWMIRGDTPGIGVDACTAGGASSGRRQRVGSIGQPRLDALTVTSRRLA